MRARLIVLLVLLVIFLIFLLQNMGLVELNFLFWDAYVSLVILLLASLIIGILLGFVIGRLGRWRHRGPRPSQPETRPAPPPESPAS